MGSSTAPPPVARAVPREARGAGPHGLKPVFDEGLVVFLFFLLAVLVNPLVQLLPPPDLVGDRGLHGSECGLGLAHQRRVDGLAVAAERAGNAGGKFLGEGGQSVRAFRQQARKFLARGQVSVIPQRHNGFFERVGNAVVNTAVVVAFVVLVAFTIVGHHGFFSVSNERRWGRLPRRTGVKHEIVVLTARARQVHGLSRRDSPALHLQQGVERGVEGLHRHVRRLSRGALHRHPPHKRLHVAAVGPARRVHELGRPRLQELPRL
mmetsp:Transcript_52795/g.105773  ORF Transcript_52795/g.105773 Transcript_52795/m.105773 type:complete len:264 (-) Transcript_52795:2125-2916(-)